MGLIIFGIFLMCVWWVVRRHLIGMKLSGDSFTAFANRLHKEKNVLLYDNSHRDASALESYIKMRDIGTGKMVYFHSSRGLFLINDLLSGKKSFEQVYDKYQKMTKKTKRRKECFEKLLNKIFHIS